MNAQNREALEAEIRRHTDARDLTAAAESAMRGYGREIFEFLAALHRKTDEASEVFSIFAECLWRALPSFAWHSSFRTWAYGVARNASHRFRREKRRREARNPPLPDGSRLSAIAEQVRTQTLSYLRTERRNRFAELRASLPQEDQELLMLRVDRQLSWNDLALVMHQDQDTPLQPDALKREAARLRKRFQLVKEKLYEMGRREGLIPNPGDDR